MPLKYEVPKKRLKDYLYIFISLSMKLTFALVSLFINSLFSFAQTRGVTVINNSATLDGKTYAIVIGISKYKNIPSLQYADRDAQAFYDYLVSDKGLNIDSSNVALSINEDANIHKLGNDVSDILQTLIRIIYADFCH